MCDGCSWIMFHAGHNLCGLSRHGGFRCVSVCSCVGAYCLRLSIRLCRLDCGSFAADLPLRLAAHMSTVAKAKRIRCCRCTKQVVKPAGQLVDHYQMPFEVVS